MCQVVILRDSLQYSAVHSSQIHTVVQCTEEQYTAVLCSTVLAYNVLQYIRSTTAIDWCVLPLANCSTAAVIALITSS